jgi:hypothetical protein
MYSKTVNPNKILKIKLNIQNLLTMHGFKNTICIENLQHNLTEGHKGKSNIRNLKNEGILQKYRCKSCQYALYCS